MSKRLRAMILGTSDAIPSDYILALAAVISIIAAVIAGMF